MCSLLKADRILVPRVAVAVGFFARGLGWMGRSAPGPNHGLLIPHCRSVHTCFMRFDLDLLFLSDSRRVVRMLRQVRPWRFAFGGPHAHSVLEIQAGWLPPEALQIGDCVRLEPQPATHTGEHEQTRTDTDTPH